jgi:hypothetical protein
VALAAAKLPACSPGLLTVPQCSGSAGRCPHRGSAGSDDVRIRAGSVREPGKTENPVNKDDYRGGPGSPAFPHDHRHDRREQDQAVAFDMAPARAPGWLGRC